MKKITLILTKKQTKYLLKNLPAGTAITLKVVDADWILFDKPKPK